MLVMIFVAILFVKPQDSSIGIQSTDASFEDFWVDYIKTYSSQKAYQDFKKAYSHISSQDQHHIGHLFGGALYKASGLSGLTTCDMDFSSGCFHEFLGRALYEHGEKILYDVDTYCKESTYDCQHGIGHGILGYTGYEFEDLQRALVLCEKIGTTDIRDGCFGGIFMEYNVRTMLGGSVSIRSHTPDEALDLLCTQVSPYARDACYFWIAQWFLAQEDGNNDQKFVAATRKCLQIDNTEHRLTCYSGLANDVPSYTSDREWYNTYCDNPELVSVDPLFSIQCRSGIATTLFADLETRSAAPKLCDPLKGDAKTFCMYFAEESDGKRIIPYTAWLKSEL
jgi:hypothetical protein